MDRKPGSHGVGTQRVEGQRFHLADEVEYIQDRAARHDGCLLTIDSLALFSTNTGDAWILDPEDHLAARLARDGDPVDLTFEETEKQFTIHWQGDYRIDGDAFIYTEGSSGNTSTILGYPTRRIAELG